MPGRSTEYSWSRMGFNGKPKDDEVYGKGNFIDYGARSLDSRIIKWITIDPLAAKYPSFSPYSYVNNMLTIATDPDGKKIYIVSSNGTFAEAKQTLLKTPTGLALWNKYSNSKTVDVYIAVGSIPFDKYPVGAETLYDVTGPVAKAEMINEKNVVQVDENSAQPEMSAFNGTNVSKSVGRKVAFILFNTNGKQGNFSDEKEATDNHTAQTRDESINNYDNAESIYHELKAHVDLNQGDQAKEHTAYGKHSTGVFRPDSRPTPGSPAEKIKMELLRVYQQSQASTPAQETTPTSGK